MDAEFLRGIIDSTTEVLEGVLKTEVRADRVFYKSTLLPKSAVPAALRLAGASPMKIYLDMEEDAARRLASAWTQQELSFSDERTKTSLQALAARIGKGDVEVVPVTTKRLAGGATAHAGTTLVVPFVTRDAGWISLDVELGDSGRKIV